MRRLFRWIGRAPQHRGAREAAGTTSQGRHVGAAGARTGARSRGGAPPQARRGPLGAPAAADDEAAAAGASRRRRDAAPTEDVLAAPADEPGPSIEERRAAIHARAQEAIDAMKETDA